MSDPLHFELLGETRTEIDKIKGSRFIATLCPVRDFEAVKLRLAEIRAEWPGATHHCWAWRGVGPTDLRSSDDGEPSGTAGAPILKVLVGRDLRGALVIVSRWFGGTKLGRGGLVRAYSEAAAAGLDAAPTEPITPKVTVTAKYDYGLCGPVDTVLHHQQLSDAPREYGAMIVLKVVVEAEDGAQLGAALTEACRGQVSVKIEPVER